MARKEQLDMFGGQIDYNRFIGKFEQKVTTDDCYTPQNIYDAVAEWVASEYCVDRSAFVRPFWPDGDYEAEEYADGCVVVDNPPFSIRSEIVDFYMRNGIRFFLFSPALTLFTRRMVCHIAVGVSVLYENGAEVATSFVTNMEDCILRTAPSLYKAIEAANRQNEIKQKKQLPRYEYPNEVVTAAMAQRWCKYGVEYRLERKDCEYISALDSMKEAGKSIFGYGLLLSERAAAERAAAERAAAERAAAEMWKLSAREKSITHNMGRREEQEMLEV